MKFNDIGIIINIKKFSQEDVIIKLISKNFGIYSALVKKIAISQKHCAKFQLGNLISFSFFSRSVDSLGCFSKVELIESFCSKLIFSKARIILATSLFNLINRHFVEREPCDNLFALINLFLEELNLNNSSINNLIISYAVIELEILKMLGFALDFSKCAVTNSGSNLHYLSPKTGRAVCFEVGKNYHNKLFIIPSFILNQNRLANIEDILNLLIINEHFFSKLITKKSYNLRLFSNEEIRKYWQE